MKELDLNELKLVKGGVATVTVQPGTIIVDDGAPIEEFERENLLD